MFLSKHSFHFFFLGSLLLFSSVPIVAQSQFNDGLYWLRFKSKVEWQSDWNVVFQLEERRFLGPDRAHQRVLPEIQLHHKFNPRWKAYLSYLNFTIASPQTADIPVTEAVNEQRIGTAVHYIYPIKKASLHWRLLNEYRLFDRDPLDGRLNYAPFTMRLRNEWSYHRSLGNGFAMVLAEELHLNWAANRNYQVFDQNRITAGLAYQWNESLSTELDYIHWYQKNRSGTEYYNRHILRFTVNYDLEFKDRI